MRLLVYFQPQQKLIGLILERGPANPGPVLHGHPAHGQLAAGRHHPEDLA